MGSDGGDLIANRSSLACKPKALQRRIPSRSAYRHALAAPHPIRQAIRESVSVQIE